MFFEVLIGSSRGNERKCREAVQFIVLMPLFAPPRHDRAETIRRALNLGVNVQMITSAFQFHNFKKYLACDPMISAYDMKCFLHMAELF